MSLLRRCFECNGLKYNSRGKPCPACGGTGFISIITREENLERRTDRRKGERRKRERRTADRRQNSRRFDEKA